MAAPPILITADELNCLIHGYLLDSGYHHSAFSLRSEAHLDRTPHFKRHIPRGELVALLSKSLLYAEVEAHWKAGKVAATCKTPFTLLEPHVCSSEVSSAPEVMSIVKFTEKSTDESAAISQEAKLKRKASTPPIPSGDGRNAKRPKEAELDNEVKVNKAASDEPKHMKGTFSGQSITPAPATKKTAPVMGGFTSPAAIRTLRSHSSEVFVVAWNPVRVGQLVSGSRDAVVNCWNIPILDKDDTGLSTQPFLPSQKLLDLTHIKQADLTSFDWSADGRLVAVGSYDSVLRVFEPEGNLYLSDDCHTGPIFAAKFSLSGKYLVTASLDSTSGVWDIQRKVLLKRYETHRGCCLDIEWIDDSTFASCGADHLIYITSLDDSSLQTLSGHTHEVNVIKCNPSRTKLASCSDDSTARVWDLNSPQKASIELDNHTASLTSIEWGPVATPEVEMLATASFDSTACLWNALTGDCLRVFADHKQHVYTLAFSPEGSMLATGGGDSYLHVYDTETMEKRWSWFNGEASGVFEIEWQRWDKTTMIALALERRAVAIIDPTKVQALSLSG